MEKQAGDALLTDLNVQIREVAKLRAEHKKMAEQRQAMYDEFIEQHTDFFADVKTAETRVIESESKLRELTIQAYNETGSKQPAEGVGIRVVTELEYDESVALNWGIEHYGMGLKLDKAVFEKIYKATPAIIDFVTPYEKVTATIAKELPVGE